MGSIINSENDLAITEPPEFNREPAPTYFSIGNLNSTNEPQNASDGDIKTLSTDSSTHYKQALTRLYTLRQQSASLS
ncbi:Uncharacterized protein MCB1EB_0328 [Mycoavidus cysteinexigens]|uniref:Uncharacterized protein n=1 Tax=Mycoavidus cysteinexigens TaxID=1553431 RepID=A0A2Z6ESV9_9BURK|nr:Uncharacterized protein MCB1EB_0328 [Mycoavidus cysteinexigens]GLR02240.1 hypothetical protein GCM10007934_20560 [Mycoavidus cysteinexigens]